MRKIYRPLLFVFICEVAGIIVVLITLPSIYMWYPSLIKPWFTPPRWIFGPVWTLLYLMMGLSAYIVWKKGIKLQKVKKAMVVFFVQLVINFFWSFLFFGLHLLFISLIDAVLLLFAAVLTAVKFWEISKTAAYILIPYILWVAFAAVLNYSVFVLNP